MPEITPNEIFTNVNSYGTSICLPGLSPKNEGESFMDTLAAFGFCNLPVYENGRKHKANDTLSLRNNDATILFKAMNSIKLNRFLKTHKQVTDKIKATRNNQALNNKLFVFIVALSTYLADGEETVGKELSKFVQLLGETVLDGNVIEILSEDDPLANALLDEGFCNGNYSTIRLFHLLNLGLVAARANDLDQKHFLFCAEWLVFLMMLLDHSSLTVVAYYFGFNAKAVEDITCCRPNALSHLDGIFQKLDNAGMRSKMFKDLIIDVDTLLEVYAFSKAEGRRICAGSQSPVDTDCEFSEMNDPLELILQDQISTKSLSEFKDRITMVLNKRASKDIKDVIDELQSIEQNCDIPIPVRDKIRVVSTALQDKAGDLHLNLDKATDLNTVAASIKTSAKSGVVELATVKTKLAEAIQNLDTSRIANIAGELEAHSMRLISDMDQNLNLVNVIELKPVSVDMVPRADYIAMESLYVEEISSLKHSLEDAQLRNQECQTKLSEAGRMINQKPETVERIEIPKPIMRLLAQEQMLMSDIATTLSDLFPHVVFMEGVVKQMEDSRFARPRQLFAALMRLCGEYYEALMRGIPDSEAMEILGDVYRANESDSVKNNDKMARLRTFDLNGTRTLFEQHITIGSRNGEQYTIQVHFKIVNRIIYIGRVGPHLTTTAKF